jgi:elongation factor G
VDVRVPEEYLGDCIGDLNSRRGHVLGMERIEGRGSVDAMQLVHATVPQRELLRYAIDLRSLTHGRGSFTTLLSHYQEAPALIAQAVIAEAKDRGFTTHHEA